MDRINPLPHSERPKNPDRLPKPYEKITLEEASRLCIRMDGTVLRPVSLRAAILRGRLKAWKYGKTWVTDRCQLWAYLSLRPERFQDMILGEYPGN